MSETSQSLGMRRVSSAERIMAYVAVVVAALSSAYLLFMLFSQHETCYGMQADKLLCQPVDAIAAARGALVLLFPGVLFIGATIGAVWQTRATAPENRNAAFGLLVTCALLLLGIVAPALAGAGFFLMPATLLMVVVAILGTVKFAQDWRGGAAQAS
jgi:hypothetical protein